MKARMILGSVLCCCFVSTGILAADLTVIQERMQGRLPQIAELKEGKAIGENRQGYLEIVDARRAMMKEDEVALIVAAENKDREAVYKELAVRVNSTAEAVGQARAREVYREAKPGVLLKTADGQWVEKQILEQK